jgi:GT2 family glycosyltransferase
VNGRSGGGLDLSVVIVSYNTVGLLRRCLGSVLASRTGRRFEVIVADNGSSDGSVSMLRAEFPGVVCLDQGENLGFARACNAAMERARGRYLLLLNPDTEVRGDTLEASVRYLESYPDVGILGCKVLLPDGRLDRACRRRFPNPRNAFLRLFGMARLSDYNVEGPIDREADVDAVTGAFLLIPRAVADRVGPLDEDFAMYGEDLDWCWRVKAAGFRVVYYPGAEITHVKSASAQTAPTRTVRQAHDAMRVFYRKHYAAHSPWVVNQLVYLGIRLRMVFVLTANVFRSRKAVH